jgi:hypothetical protein
MEAVAAASLLLGGGLVLTSTAGAAANGPYGFPNSAVADRAEAFVNGAPGGQCLVFAENMIAAAGGPRLAFGYDTGTYQAQWAKNAASVASLGEAQRGDIVQWGGGAGGSPHTAIITAGGATPQGVQVIDSNFGYDESVGRGSLSSRTAGGSVYRVWRVGVAAQPAPTRPDFTGDGRADLLYQGFRLDRLAVTGLDRRRLRLHGGVGRRHRAACMASVRRFHGRRAGRRRLPGPGVGEHPCDHLGRGPELGEQRVGRRNGHVRLAYHWRLHRRRQG